MFVFYLDDVALILGEVSYHLFADHTAIYLTEKDVINVVDGMTDLLKVVKIG